MCFVSRLAWLTFVLGSAIGPASFAESIPIGGQVTASGKPAAGVAVRLLPVVEAYDAGELLLAGKADPEPEVEARTETDGRFELAAPDIGFFRLRFELEGRVPREVWLEPLLYATELGEIELEADAGFRVRIDAGGEPATARMVAYPIDPAASRRVGRPVRLSELGSSQPLFAGRVVPAATDGEPGDVRVPAIGTEKAWLVEITADGFVPLQHRTTDRSRQLELTLERGVSRKIRTVDADGEPLGGVLLFGGGGDLPLAKTDAGGFAILALPAAGGLTLTALDPLGRRGSLRLAPVAEPSAERLELITLTSPRTVSGRVVEEPSREPIEGALVWVGADSAVRTDAGGSYSVRLPPPTPRVAEYFEVRAAAVDHVADRDYAPLEGSAGPTLALSPAGRLSGRVVDAASEGLAEVTIEYQAVAGGSLRYRRLGPGEKQRARSAADGRFELTGLAAGRDHRLLLTKADFAPRRLEVPPLAAFEHHSDLEIVLDRGRRAIGRVVDEQERPIAGAKVRLSGPVDPRRREKRSYEVEEDMPRATTGGDGRFSVTDLATGSYDLKVSAAGFGPAAVPGLEVSAGDGVVDLGTVSLPPAVAIEGRVVDGEGRPIAGVEIRAGEGARRPLPAVQRLTQLAGVVPAITGADGHFTVADRRAGEHLDLIVTAEGYVARAVTGVVAPPEELLHIVLHQISRVSGRVVDERGDPVAGADVEVRGEGLGGRLMANARLTRSAADGRFELLDIEPGKVSVAAGAAGYRVTRTSGLEAPAGGELRDVELVLRPGAMIAGTVTDAGGMPEAEVDVRVSAGGRAEIEAVAVTDGDGRFELWGVGLGRRTIWARAEDGRQTSKAVDVDADGLSVELRFTGGAEVSGRVVDDAGSGLLGATVWLDVNARGLRRSVSETTSVADGSFVFKGVTAGSYRLMAFKPGYADAMLQQPIQVGTNPVRGLEIRLDQGSTISGRIVGLDLDDLARVEVRGGGRTGKVDFEGHYRIERVPPGQTIVSAMIPGTGREVRHQITVAAGAGEVLLDLELGGGHVLTGLVVAGEQPVVGAAVNLVGAGGARTGGSAVTDPRGRFRIEGLESGGYRVMVRSWESGAWHREELELVADEDVRIQIGSSRAAGRVRDRDSGEPVAGARLSLVAAGSAAPDGKSTTSDSRGYFSFAAVPEGSWLLRASRPGYAEAEIPFTLHFGEVVEDLDVLLAASTGLSFKVVTTAGAPPPRVRVAVLDAGGQRIAGGAFRTLEGGRVELTSVPEGDWQMLVAAGDSAITRLPIAAPGDAGRVQLATGGGVRVVVPDLADGLVRADVELVGPDGQPHQGLSWVGEVLAKHPVRGGHATISNLMPGTWTVRVVDVDGRTWSTSAMVPQGTPVTVILP